MAAGIHFIFELFKIALLSALYGSIIFLVIKLLIKDQVKGKKLWGKCFHIVYVLLFVFMFTYWGDHGLGDDSILPIPHHQTLNQSDESVYVENKNGGQIWIGKFSYDKNFLYAELNVNRLIRGDYLIWNLKTDQLLFATTNEYLALSKDNKAAQLTNFNDFAYYYDQYWSGWRFWLLP